MQALLTQPTPLYSLLSVNSDDNFIYVYNTTGRQIVEIDLRLLAQGIINDTWFGIVLDKEYIAFLEGIYYDIFTKFKLSKKLCNIKKLDSSFDGINDWFSKTYNPKLIERGLKYNALVMPEELCAQLSVAFYIEEVSSLKLENKIFDSKEEALLWLESKE